jgi:hypothetical protein
VDDPGSISPGGDLIITNGEGIATFRVTSEGAKNFLRLEEPIAIGL